MRVRSPRNGFTIIELLVVISIIGLLCLLLLSAVQASREAARRMRCTSQLRQVGVALHNHQSTHNLFPAGHGKVGESYIVRLLPFMEQTQIFNALNLTGIPFNLVIIPQNTTAMVHQVGLTLCPSDASRSHIASNASSNYAANAGSDVATGDGVFIGRGLAPSEITDGLGHTVGLSEWVIGDGNDSRGTRLGSLYKLPDSITAYADFSAACGHLDERVTKPYPPGFKGLFWIQGGLASTQYNHVLPPGYPSCSNSHLTATTSASNHSGGVNVLSLDGGVHFVSTSIDPKVWVALGTRAGEEVVSQEFLR